MEIRTDGVRTEEQDDGAENSVVEWEVQLHRGGAASYVTK